MKVLIINSVCGIRSTGRICTDLAEVLESNGHECKIAYGRETVPEKFKKYAVRIGNDMGVKIDGMKSRIFDNAGFNSASATMRSHFSLVSCSIFWHTRDCRSLSSRMLSR